MSLFGQTVALQYLLLQRIVQTKQKISNSKGKRLVPTIKEENVFFYYFLSQPRCLAVTVRRWSINPISGCRIFGGKAPDGEYPSDKGRISGGFPLSGYQVFDCPLSDRVARHGNRFPILIGSSLIVKGNVRIPLAAPTLLLSLSLIYAPIAQPREPFSVHYS